MTLIIALSIHPLRRAHYEAFYFLHVLLVPLFLVTAALHHPPVWWWCWAAIGLWIGERLWRATWWLHSNGYFGGMSVQTQAYQHVPPHRQQEPWRDSLEMKHSSKQSSHNHLQDSSTYSFPPPRQPYPPYSHQTNLKSPLSPISSEDPRTAYSSRAHTPTSSLHHVTSPSVSSHLRTPLSPVGNEYVPPPGYAHAELLSGRTIRLRFISPGFFSWAPGQHFLVSIPSVSRFTTHPFTAASVCDEQAGDAGRELVFLVRAKSGWTQELWDAVAKLTVTRQSHPRGERPTKGSDMPPRGVLMRMYVDGPFGSSVRARWGSHSTVLIITGGSGVSFGLSVLEYICMCLSGRDGRNLGGRPGGWGKKGFSTTRVRFVWLVREFCMQLPSFLALPVH